MLFLVLWSFCLMGRVVRHNFSKGPPKDHSSQVWLRLAQFFQKEDFSNFIPPLFYFYPGSDFVLWSGLSVIILKEDHPETIPSKFGQNWWAVSEEKIFSIIVDGQQMPSDEKSTHGLKLRPADLKSWKNLFSDEQIYWQEPVIAYQINSCQDKLDTELI